MQLIGCARQQTFADFLAFQRDDGRNVILRSCGRWMPRPIE